VFGATLFDVNLQPIVASRIEVYGQFYEPCPTFCMPARLRFTVPEPGAASLALAGLCALALGAIVRARP